MFKLSAVIFITLVVTGCQSSSKFTVLPEREMVTADNGVAIGVKFNYTSLDEPGIIKTGVTAYCANGVPTEKPMSTSPFLTLPEPGWLTNQAPVGRPPSMTYYTISYQGVQEVLTEVCKFTEEDMD